ncbi:hypothetical protein TWF506_004302 [Arthrobotrys conoides]|uniref:Uncharacterized protein n=1 Tax=Arthrobotrys conoides TaxID=74498 RepID=A0AAN8NJT2_9PEZI
MRFAIGAFAFLALSGSVSAQCDGSCECEVDDCFQALAGSLPFMNQANVEVCRDQLWDHSTWGESTSTVTSYVMDGAITRTISETEITTVTEGTTTVETVTATVTETLTTTSGVGSFTGEVFTTVKAPLRRRRRKRQQKDVPSSASACSDFPRYSSACICIGVAAEGTRWTKVPVVTTTITATASATVTITTTEVGNFAGTTETSTLEKTATQEVIIPRTTSFVIQLTQDDANGLARGYFLKSEPDPNNNNLRRLLFTDNVEEATLYKADGSGVITTDADDLGFGRDAATTGPGIWQESASGRTGWVDYICKLTAERLISCNDQTRTFFAYDPNNNLKMRAYTYLNNLLPQGCIGPIVMMAVPAHTKDVAPAAAINAVIRSRTGSNNSPYEGWYMGQQFQQSQPFPRIRFFESIDDAIIFRVDPVNGNIFGPNTAPFSAANPASESQPTPFLIGGFDSGHLIRHLLADLPGTNVLLQYPPDYRWLGAVIVDQQNPGTPFFRFHTSSAMLADEAGPLTFDIVRV